MVEGDVLFTSSPFLKFTKFHSLSNFFLIKTLFENARLKDPDFDLDVFICMTGRYSRTDRLDFSVSEARYHELMESANYLRE